MHTLIPTNPVLLGVLGDHMAAAVVVVAVFLIVVPNVVVVASVEVVVVADLPTLSVKFALSTATLPIFVIFSLT